MIRSWRNATIVAGMLLSLYACADQPTAPEQTVVLGGQKLTLENDQQRCVLRKADQSVQPLDMAWPCQFAVDKNGQPHIETFASVPIVIALHVGVDPENSQFCRSAYRAIRLIKGQLELSVVSPNASCAKGAGDQKNYTGVFRW